MQLIDWLLVEVALPDHWSDQNLVLTIRLPPVHKVFSSAFLLESVLGQLALIFK
jgi:hypothetical protein